MDYRRLGRSGLKISELSFGSWLTVEENLDVSLIKTCIHTAFNHGVNFFDTAEVYGGGLAETFLGKALKEYRREDLVISTKLFWGGKGPNDIGLSRKHLMEGIDNSLRRLQMEYVDLLFCHRPDTSTPIEETVRAMDTIIKSGKAFYWGTSEWPAESIEKAFQIAREIGAIPPTMEQTQYNLFTKSKMENEYLSLFERHSLGTTIWSPLASGILSGKYKTGIPRGSRFALHPEFNRFSQEQLSMLSILEEIANNLGCSMAQLSIAWCLKNPHVSSVILGASHPKQLIENLAALKIKQLLDDQIMQALNQIS